MRSYLKKFTIGNPNKNHALADQIYNYFGKKIAFSRIMRIITEKGYQATYEMWNEVRKSDAMNPIALFLWKVKNVKIKWDNP